MRYISVYVLSAALVAFSLAGPLSYPNDLKPRDPRIQSEETIPKSLNERAPPAPVGLAQAPSNKTLPMPPTPPNGTAPMPPSGSGPVPPPPMLINPPGTMPMLPAPLNGTAPLPPPVLMNASMPVPPTPPNGTALAGKRKKAKGGTLHSFGLRDEIPEGRKDDDLERKNIGSLMVGDEDLRGDDSSEVVDEDVGLWKRR